MFNSIKSKVIILTTILLFALTLILSFTILAYYKHDKALMVESCDFSISTFAEQVNKQITKLNNNVTDLATMGELYYQTGKSKNLANFIVRKIFNDYKESLGGGIWFEPYSINKNQLRNCTYAFREVNGNVVIDESFNSEKYNYLNQNWYKEIKEKLPEGKSTVWTTPYYENQGSETLMTTVGAGIYSDNKLIGIATVDWQISAIIKTISQMKPTPNSFALFADTNNDFIIVSNDIYLNNNKLLGKSLNNIPWYSKDLKNGKTFNYHNKTYISYIKPLSNEMLLIINVPQNELLSFILKQMYLMLFVLLLSSTLVSLIVYYMLTKYINRPISKLMYIAKEIGQGNLDVHIDIESPQEFAKLGDTFEKMTSDIKDYIKNLKTVTGEKEKIEAELAIAKTIQYSALPSTFYPKTKEFDIYATMDTAKEVGGDFYDFFFIDQTHFMFLIADVSGKGIPAALFMMTTKTLIKNLAVEGFTPKELFEKINNQICENNKQGFFVTLLAGITDIESGETTFVNCGHNPPILKHADGEFEYIKMQPNLVLGAMENISYSPVKINFEKGDIMFLYTDGVTEALNDKEELYGENRLKDCLNKIESKNITSILTDIKTNVEEFSKGVEQSDDITMLGFKYNGKDGCKEEFVAPATVKNFQDFYGWLNNCLETEDVSSSVSMKINLVAEEIFVNIASYAYKGKQETGDIIVLFEKNEKYITLKFIDNGYEYNPLEKADPDLTLNADDRQIGGLGIYMVKQSVDKIYWERKDEKNILTVSVKFL